ncbi:MAG: hypothetical protein CMB77_07795 [Euryarchaeota archaeon]|nr:hypothetical protein [Euryarchaeota archaeon]
MEDHQAEVVLTGSAGLDFVILNPPKNGYLIGELSKFIYKPDTNYFGNDFFTFKGVIGERETIEGVVNIAITAVNDPPTINSQTILAGSKEENETFISYEHLALASGAQDVEGLALSFLIERVLIGNLQKADYEPITSGQHVVNKSSKGLIWTPPPNLNGKIKAFIIRSVDDEIFSSESSVFIKVEAVPDSPVLLQPISDIALDEGSDPFEIDLSQVFFDPDNDPKTYFIKDVEKDYIVNAQIIEDSKLQLVPIEQMNGDTLITVGLESNSEIIYDTFELKINSIIDDKPHIVRDYWKGYSEDLGIDIPMDPPVAYWSFESIEAIEKTSVSNWRFTSENEPAGKILESPNATTSAENWLNIFHAEANSIRVQSSNFLAMKPDITMSGNNPIDNVSKYTLVYDIRIKYGQPNPILNTLQIESTDRSEVWLNPLGAVGGQREYSSIGSLKPGLWYRVIYVVNLDEGYRKYYVDFTNVLNQPVTEKHINRHKIGGEGFMVGRDSLNKNHNYELKKLVFYDYDLSESQVQLIGFSGYEELGEQQNKSSDSRATLSLITPNFTDDESIVTQGIIIYSNDPASTSWIIQKSSDLVSWQKIGQIEVDATDESGGVGFLEIKKILESQKSFYRAKAND